MNYAYIIFFVFVITGCSNFSKENMNAQTQESSKSKTSYEKKTFLIEKDQQKYTAGVTKKNMVIPEKMLNKEIDNELDIVEDGVNNDNVSNNNDTPFSTKTTTVDEQEKSITNEIIEPTNKDKPFSLELYFIKNNKKQKFTNNDFVKSGDELQLQFYLYEDLYLYVYLYDGRDIYFLYPQNTENKITQSKTLLVPSEGGLIFDDREAQEYLFCFYSKDKVELNSIKEWLSYVQENPKSIPEGATIHKARGLQRAMGSVEKEEAETDVYVISFLHKTS